MTKEYCDMPTLTGFVGNWKLREREASCFEAKRSAMVQLIDAIGRCHGRSIFHRDLKPENVLVHKDGCSIRLIDFGLAVGNPISSNCRTGTREYMSPGVYSFF
jgi:serine/threonine protein kinase